MPVLPRLAPVALAPLLLLLAACAGPAVRPTAETPAAITPADDHDALPRLRAGLPPLLALQSSLDLHLVGHEAPDEPLPPFPESFARDARPLLAPLALGPGEHLVFPRIHGPETPFPDHQPLRQLAAFRTVLARQSLENGDVADALALVRENLRLARAVLRAQEGIIPLINATGVWQSALDGVHALARSPALSAADARLLLAELQADSGLAQEATARALTGEFEYVYRVIVARMPETDDPDLFLSSVASLGMSPPEPLEIGETGLGVVPPDFVILDRAAALAAYQADLAPYLAALAREARQPRGLYDATTAPALAAHRAELGRFLRYANGELSPDLTETTLARGELLAATNPGGKLLAVYLTPVWPVYIATALRREAQRSALCGLLAWRIHGSPTDWETLVSAGILPAPPADPFSDGALRFELAPLPRVWSVFIDGLDQGGQPVSGNSGQPDDLVWLR